MQAVVQIEQDKAAILMQAQGQAERDLQRMREAEARADHILRCLCVCVSACLRVCACVRACWRACVRACVRLFHVKLDKLRWCWRE